MTDEASDPERGEPRNLGADDMRTLFILRHRFQRSPEDFAAAYGAHRSFVMGHIAAGRFLAGGPLVPWDGGVILAAVPDRAEAERIAASDPLVHAGITEYEVTEWRTTTRAAALTALLDGPAGGAPQRE